VRLVGGARHQAREGELHALRAVALEDEDIERIEGEKVLIEGPGCPNMGKESALRGVWIDVIQMLEVGRIFKVAASRHAVAIRPFPYLDLRCFNISGERRCDSSHSKEERSAAC